MSQRRYPAKWVIRAGKRSEAHNLFLKKSVIGLHDAGLGDLRLLPPNRSAFYRKFAEASGNANRVTISAVGGKFFRFSQEIVVGDEILYPSRLDKRVYMGVVTGDYVYISSDAEKLPHRRSVQWIGFVPKVVFSRGAQRELGAARTFFRFTSHGHEADKIRKGLPRMQRHLDRRLHNDGKTRHVH
jgi:restriction system protein